MATETEELKLVVNLVDNASAGIMRLRQELAQLSGGATAGNLDRLKNKGKEAGDQFKMLGLSAQDSSRVMKWGTNLVSGALGALSYDILKQSTILLPDWADKL